MAIFGKKRPPAPPVKDFVRGRESGMDFDDRPMPPPRSMHPTQHPKMERHEEKRRVLEEDEGFEIPHTPEKYIGKSPPIFIKIERYKEVVNDVQRLRATAIGLRDAIDALGDIEKEMQTALSMVSKAISKLSMGISAMESKFSRVSAMEELEMPEGRGEIDKSVQHLYDQMDRIKRDLTDL